MVEQISRLPSLMSRLNFSDLRNQMGFILTCFLNTLLVVVIYFTSLSISENHIVNFKSGQSVDKLLLEIMGPDQASRTDRGIIRYFIILTGMDRHLQAGSYEVIAGDTVVGLLGRMKEGVILLRPFTIIEGWDVFDFRDELMEREIAIDIPLTSKLEGTLWPETYFISNTDRASTIIKRAQALQKQYIEQAWKKRDKGLPWRNPTQAIIAASMVEKETALLKERPMVARVIINRLEKWMHLQIDSTVIYGVKEPIEKVYYKQTRIKHPLNTYTKYGLPKHPICMPSQSSIDAVLHPAQGSMLYYVLQKDGSHYFSKTLKEHNEAKRRWKEP